MSNNVGVKLGGATDVADLTKDSLTLNAKGSITAICGHRIANVPTELRVLENIGTIDSNTTIDECLVADEGPLHSYFVGAWLGQTDTLTLNFTTSLAIQTTDYYVRTANMSEYTNNGITNSNDVSNSVFKIKCLIKFDSITTRDQHSKNVKTFVSIYLEPTSCDKGYGVYVRARTYKTFEVNVVVDSYATSVSKIQINMSQYGDEYKAYGAQYVLGYGPVYSNGIGDK